MLTEIYCEAFGEDKKVPFTSGLNIIQGRNGNSIGKSSVLKIIDYAFGGKYYAESNDDIIKHVGDHDICFSHMFDGEVSYFRRNAKSPSKVLCCSDGKYIAQKEISVDEFCKWLLMQYGLQNRSLTFRETVGLYVRVWNKPNKEVNRPLYNYSTQTLRDSIISLIKLFNKFESISELNAQSEYIKKRERVLKDAVNYHLLKLPTPKESSIIIADLTEIKEKISQLKSNIAIASAENMTNLNEKSSHLLEQRLDLLKQQGRILRDVHRVENTIQQLSPFEENTFVQLQEFFPEVNIKRIAEVQKFHESLRKILIDELQKDEARSRKQLEDIDIAIRKNENEIQVITGLPTQAHEAIDTLLQLIKKQENLQSQLDLYNDKATDIAQKKENKEQLDALLDKITSEIEGKINTKIKEFSKAIISSNNKAPELSLSNSQYHYGVEDNTGTGKAYTDLILFDLAILSLTDLPILIHDSFLFNNIDDVTKQSFLKLYSNFTDKQVFISLDTFLGSENDEIDQLLLSTTRLFLSESKTLFGQDWRN